MIDQSIIGPEHYRVLEILAKASRCRDVNALLSRGFRYETLADLVRNGLATVSVKNMRRRGRPIEVACLTITDTGREAFEIGTSRRS